MAQNAPFEVKALGDAFVKMKVGGIDPANGSLQALVDSVARFGGNGESLKRAATAIQQMGGKGVISMEELRQQLGEAVPDAMQALATGVGLTMGQLTKEIAKGTVQAAGNLDRMFAVLAVQNRGAAAEMANTWTGLTEQLKTKWLVRTASSRKPRLR
jgi:tape measure domain-containing protein